MKTDYKCRAETGADVRKVRDHWRTHNIILENDNVEDGYLDFGDGNRVWIPDVEWTFTTEATLETLIQLAKEIADTHVIWETLKPLELYTGNRWEEFEVKCCDCERSLEHPSSIGFNRCGNWCPRGYTCDDCAKSHYCKNCDYKMDTRIKS